jgi:hypothetical protein
VETPDVQVHLCARCHNRRSVPDANSSHGLEPHSPETELLVGEAGWFPPNVEFDRGDILGTHGTENNPTLCAKCHVDMFTITDEATGEFVFNSVGHLFSAIPCVDEEGRPVAGDCEITTQARTFGACVDSACHSSEDGAAGLLNLKGGAVALLAADLIALLELVDPNLDEPFDGVDPATGIIDPTVSTFTIAEGAFFNYSLATHGGDVYGSTVHNPFLTEALLEFSIDAVEDEYGVSLP